MKANSLLSSENRRRRMSRKPMAKPFMYAIIAAGVAVCGYSIFHLPVAQLDVLFLLLAGATVAVTSRIAVRMPGVNGRITLSETFIFLTMLLYGGEAGILLAPAAGLCSSPFINSKPFHIRFHDALLAFLT